MLHTRVHGIIACHFSVRAHTLFKIANIVSLRKETEGGGVILICTSWDVAQCLLSAHKNVYQQNTRWVSFALFFPYSFLIGTA